jgi:hypothetical protein
VVAQEVKQRARRVGQETRGPVGDRRQLQLPAVLRRGRERPVGVRHGGSTEEVDQREWRKRKARTLAGEGWQSQRPAEERHGHGLAAVARRWGATARVEQRERGLRRKTRCLAGDGRQLRRPAEERAAGARQWDLAEKVASGLL